MRQPSRSRRRGLERIFDAGIAGIAVLAVVLGVAAHDGAAVVYWTAKFERGSMFRSQFLSANRHPNPGPKEVLADRIVAFQTIRFQSDLSVGLAIVSLGLTAWNVRRCSRYRRAWLRPGAAAALASSAVLVLWGVEQGATSLGTYSRGLWGKFPDPLLNQWPLIEQRVGLAVLGTWPALVACRRWHPRRSWDDRLGRVVGVLWLTQLLFRLATPVLFPIANARF